MLPLARGWYGGCPCRLDSSDTSTYKTLGGLRSGECGDHAGSRLRLMGRLGNFWSSHFMSHGRDANRVQRWRQWYQQDGATPHRANVSLKWLDQKFPKRPMGRKREPEWSPHFPDLNPPRVLSVEVFEGSCLQEQSPHHPRAKGSNHQRNQSYTQKKRALKSSPVKFKCVFSRTEHIWSIFYK